MVTEASHILIATISESRTQHDKYWHSTTIILTPISYLKEKIEGSPFLSQTIAYPSLFDKNGPKKGCPSSISFVKAHHAKHLKIGSKLIATVVIDHKSGSYTVTGTFGMENREKIKTWIKKRTGK